MEIKVSDKIVGFDYMVKTDTPEVVARECVRDFNFDQKYYTYVKLTLIKSRTKTNRWRLGFYYLSNFVIV